MVFQRHHSALIVASAITVASFVGATVYTQNRLSTLDELSSTIENNAVPSIEYLSRTAVRLARINQLLDDIAATRGHNESALATARAEVAALESDVARYVQLPPLVGERNFWDALRSDVTRAVSLVRASLDAEQRSQAPDTAADTAVDDALDRAIRTVLATIEFDVKQAEQMAADVRVVRARALRRMVTLDAAATAVALIAVVIAYRASRRHDALLGELNLLLSARVTELDRFAGRVAHDVLSPLGTIGVGLALLNRSASPQDRTYIDRSERALQRVQQLVEDLLTFARSGARPDASARCAVREAIASGVADCSETAAEKQIDVVVDAPVPMVVPCSAGVVTSIVQNLVRNAIRYMGNRPVRRIVVRTRANGSVARLEVEDTGPGIPSSLQASIFEPFVRGPNEEVTGSGLGLATVKRLAESHGGAAGVQSKPGDGSIFWVELPLAGSDPERKTPADNPHYV